MQELQLEKEKVNEVKVVTDSRFKSDYQSHIYCIKSITTINICCYFFISDGGNAGTAT